MATDPPPAASTAAVLAAPAPPPEADPTTGIRHTPEAALLLLAQQVRELREEVADLRASTWTAVLREQLDRPLWPGRVELRLGTVLLLGGALVAAFGSERVAGWASAWVPGVVGVAP